MRPLFGTLLFLLATSLPAQVGLGMFYNNNTVSNHNYNGNPELADLDYQNGTEAALYYWFRLPKQRIEFMPTVYSTTVRGDRGWVEAGFQFKTNIYLFDLGTDCHCPTFGKQGPQLQKGFFVQVSPGISLPFRQDPPNDSNSFRAAFTLGGGLGLDIGISNLLTLTPFAGMRYSLTDVNALDGYFTDTEVPASTFRLTTYQLGLSATFRFDNRNY